MKLPSEYLEQGWCQGKSSVDVHGSRCDFDHSNAVAWCHTGAMYRAFDVVNPLDISPNNNQYWAYRNAIEVVMHERYGTHLILQVNDGIYDPESGQAQAVADAREAERKAGLR